jgi:transketolase
MVHNVNSGHPGGSLLYCTEFMVALYQNLMDRKEGFDMDGIEKIFSSFQTDIYLTRFYSVLARSGYFPVSELATFRLINSRLQGHPTTHDGLPGIRIASGSLGQGMSVGIELLKLKIEQ